MANRDSRQLRRTSIVIPTLTQGPVKPGFEPGCRDCAKATAGVAEARRGAVPPAAPRAAAIGRIAVVTSDGVEVTQAIQNMAHDVPLVADKRTIARVYLSNTAPAPMLVQGLLIGFDTGDPAHGLPIKALPGTTWHDVMTYCSSQWISSFTYTGIRDRLLLEDALPAGAMPVVAGRSKRTGSRKLSATPTTHVVATLNLTRATGDLRHVTAYAALPPGGELLAASKAATARRGSSGPAAITLRLYAGSRKAPQEFTATFIPDACTNPGDDVTGSIDALIAAPTDAARLELVLNGHVVDTYEAGTAPRAVRDIPSASAPARARRRGVVAGADQDDRDALITWQETGLPKAGVRARSAESNGRTYVVQVSADDGQTCQTAGFGLSEPQTSIDRRLFGTADTVRVRVIASDGFRSVTTEKTLKVADI